MFKKVIKLSLVLILALSAIIGFNQTNVSAKAKARAYYAKEGARLYKGKSTKSKKLKLLNQNQKVTTTTGKTAKFFKVKIGKTNGYVAKSQMYTKKTWIYKANYKNILVYKNTKRSKWTYLKNKKGASLVSHKKPGADLIQLTVKGKNYYVSNINVNIDYKIKKVQKAFANIKKKTKYEYVSKTGYFDSYYLKNKGRATQLKKKLAAYGFVQTKYGDQLYAFKYSAYGTGNYQSFDFRVCK